MAAGIGQDIRTVINSLCTKIEYPERGNFGETIDYESNTQATKPQTAEHFLLTTFVDNSIVKAGDLVKFLSANTHYRVMNVFDETFENKVIYKQCILYKCNVTVDVYEPQTLRDPDTLEVTESFRLREPSTAVICMLIDKLYGTRLDDEEQRLIQQEIKGRVMYFPKTRPIMAKDRVIVRGETLPYEVTSLEEHTFPGMTVVYLEEDTRSNIMLSVDPEIDPIDPDMQVQE